MTLLAFDQLTFDTWRAESPAGRVLAPEEAVAHRYVKPDWEERMARTPAPLSADTTLPPRTLVIGIEERGASRAYPVEAVTAAHVVLDDLGGTAIAIVRAPDGRSTRVFDRTVDGRALDLVAQLDRTPFRLLDLASGSEWDFNGTAVAGPLIGRTLRRLSFLEEYWFDWKTYHPSTDVSRR